MQITVRLIFQRFNFAVRIKSAPRSKVFFMGASVMLIGLTGGIAAGKSTVSSHLQSLGIPVIDYDALARKVVEPGSAVLQEIARVFGARVLDSDGSLCRSWLAQYVFDEDADPSALQKLNAIEHPAIFQEAQRVQDDIVHHSKHPVIIVHDIPLLTEVYGSIPWKFDHIVSVEAPVNVRVQRMMHTRGMSKSQAMARIAKQASEAERLTIADIVIDSTQPIEQMFENIDIMVDTWTKELM